MKEKIVTIIRTTGLVYAIAFIGTSVIFIFFSHQLLAVINDISDYLFPSLPQVYEQTQFYKILALSMMAGVTVCSLLLYKDVHRYCVAAIPLAAMKFVSSVTGIVVFVIGTIAQNGWNNLANCIIFLTDFPLGVWIFYLYVVYKRYYTM